MPYDDSGAKTAETKERRPKLSDDDFLQIVRSERRQAIGMEEQNEILSDRIQALDYFKGEMNDASRGDPVAMPGRSQVVSTDVRDAVLTALPDLCEIFLGEIGSFRPQNADDEKAAKQETQVVNHVIMSENDGFSLVYDGIMDALLVKTGVYTWWVEKYEKEETESFTAQTALQQQAAAQSGAIEDLTQTDTSDVTGEPLYSFTVRRKKTDTCFKVESVAPEDFAVARDTTGSLRKSTYCVMRTRPRAQKLKEMGFDPDAVDDLPAYSMVAQQEIAGARDTAGENENVTGAGDAGHDLRQVIVYVHVVVLDAYGNGELKPWRIVTDEQEGVVLDKQELTDVPFAGMTPYKIPHRFYGLSLADVLLEIQRIKTALTRMHLDGGFFSLNARMEVSAASANEHTLTDLLNNTPGYPVRSKDGNALKPLMSSKSDFNALESLEYFATEGEKKSGIVRNAQGLNPDTLHDTMGGAAMLVAAAIKRTRFVARVLAETGFKDLMLGVHAMIREHGSEALTVRLGGEWVPVDPTSWGERRDMTIEIGSGGQDQEVAMLTNLGNVMEKIIEGQATGAISPPVLKSDGIYKWVTTLADASRKGAGEKYFSDPAKEPPAQPKPDPATMKIQSDAQLAQQQQRLDAQAAQAKQQLDEQVNAAKLQQQSQESDLKLQIMHQTASQQADLANQKAAFEADLANQKFQQETDMAERKMQMDYQLRMEEIAMNERVQRHANETKAAAISDSAGLPANRPGGDLSK